jgi:pimeloyl-ACP methyl ester carboxylesterase
MAQVTSQPVSVRSLDGLLLRGTLDGPAGRPRGAALLLHGGGVTRDEGGFFTRLAVGLAEAGVMSLRVDLPGHGESPGRQEDLTFAALMNVTQVGLSRVREAASLDAASVVAASFSGGYAAYYAAKRGADVDRLVLFNPLIDYKVRFVDEKPAWAGGAISDKGAQALLDQGYVGHGPSFRLGRPILNEVFWFTPRSVLSDIVVPTLVVHGSKDTFISVESSRDAVRQMTCERRLIELDGAQHGFAVHDDPEYADPQSQAWQASVITETAAWLTA